MVLNSNTISSMEVIKRCLVEKIRRYFQIFLTSSYVGYVCRNLYYTRFQLVWKLCHMRSRNCNEVMTKYKSIFVQQKPMSHCCTQHIMR